MGELREQDSELLNAAINGNAAKIAKLLSKGANVKAVSNSGWTALHLAKLYKHSEAATVLREAEKRAENMASTMRELKNVLSRVERLSEMKERRNRVK